MPGSTGPDLNTYIIPEVLLGDTFNYWRDSTNTAIYKLNKLKIYDAVDSASIGATYGTTGAWQALIQPTVTSGHTFTSFMRLTGGLTTTFLFASSGVTMWSNLYVNGGTTLASTLDVSGVARFGAGVTVAANADVGGVLRVTGNSIIGGNAGSTLGVCGSVRLYSKSGVFFYDSSNTYYLRFTAPSSLAANRGWTLPSVDGSGGQVITTDGSGNLSWKNADGVTGSDRQVQFNQGGALGSTASFVFDYAATSGYSAGTLGVSGGAWVQGNVAIGFTGGVQVGRRVVGGNAYSSGKLEVAGDIRIPSGGFFVNSNITIPAGVCGSVGATENAFMSGTLTIATGATLTIESGGSVVVL